MTTYPIAVPLTTLSNMYTSLLVGMCTLVMACTGAFVHPFLFEDFTQLPSPNMSNRLQLPVLKSRSEESGIPWRGLRGDYVHNRIVQNEIQTRRVENMLTDFFSALLHADDCTLLERQTQGMGVVYLDVGFNVSRPPLLLRHGVQDIMSKYNVPLRPVERKWNVARWNESTSDEKIA